MVSKLLVFASTFAFVSAQSVYTGVYGLGYWNETYAFEANQNPNNTKSVPFQIGTQNYTFQVNVAEFTPTGPGLISTRNPRQAASFYNLIWSEDEYLNETLLNAVTSTGQGTPQLCVTVHTGPMARSITNNYREQDNGDCSHAFGKQCMDDLKKVDAVQINNCNALWMPKSCTSKFGDGDVASTSKCFHSSHTRKKYFLYTDNFTELVDPAINTTNDLFSKSPVEFSFYRSQVFSAGNTSYYEREDERLHVAFLSGSWGVTPVCNRVNNTKLGKNDIAVLQGGAASVRGSIGLSVVIALAVTIFIL
jgi:hypothetical protein